MKKIILIIMLVLLTMGDSKADWKKDLKKTADGIRKTTKKATKEIKKTTKKTKEGWDKREHPCAQCGKMTHLGKLCAECQRKAALNSARKIRKQGKKIINVGKKSAQKVSEDYKKWSPVVQEKYGEALENIQDPEQRAKVKKVLMNTAKVASQIKQAKKKGTYLGLSKVTSIKLPRELGGKTLGEELSERLTKTNPELAKTGLFEDPALALTAVVCSDPEYFANDFKCIKRDGKNVSLMESIEMSSSFNASGTIKSFKALAAAEQLATGEGDIEDVIRLGDAINSINK